MFSTGMCSLMLYPLHIKSILSKNPSKCWFSEACPRGAILASKIDQLRFSNPHFRILRVKYSLMQKVSSLCDHCFIITKIKALCGLKHKRERFDCQASSSKGLSRNDVIFGLLNKLDPPPSPPDHLSSSFG